MAKYVSTKDSSIGARVLPDGKYAIAREVNGIKVSEIIESAEDIKNLIDTAIPIAQHIIRALSDFFSSIINPFPPVIIQNGEAYRLTEQRAPWGAIDRVFYMSENDRLNTLFYHEDKRMPTAKKYLRQELKDYGYIK